MVTIRVVEVAGSGDTTEQGLRLWQALLDAFDKNDNVVVSFEGITTATSSFVNVSFVRLFEIMSFSEVKRRVRVIKSTRQINEMIRSRLEKESALISAGAKSSQDKFIHVT